MYAVKVRVRSRVGEDGILHLDVPVGLTDVDLDVTVTIQPVTPPAATTPDELGWEPGFIERTYGSCADEPLVRYPQGEYEEREPLNEEKKKNIQAAIEGLRSLRQQIALKGLSVRDMIEEGRRF